MFLRPSCRVISIAAANTKRHIVNDLVGDELVCAVRFGTPGRKFGHRRRGPFTLPPRTVLNLSGSLTTSAPFPPQRCRFIGSEAETRQRILPMSDCDFWWHSFHSFCENGSQRLEHR